MEIIYQERHLGKGLEARGCLVEAGRAISALQAGATFRLIINHSDLFENLGAYQQAGLR